MLIMDSISYNVRVVYPSMERSFEIPQGQNAGKSLAYSDIADIFGTEYSYEFDVEPVPGAQSDYDAFFHAISAPVASHEITLPHGQTAITFDAKVTSGGDVFRGTMGGVKRWGGLRVRFVPIEPQRTA